MYENVPEDSDHINQNSISTRIIIDYHKILIRLFSTRIPINAIFFLVL